MHDFSVEPSESDLCVLELLQRRIPAAPLGYLRQLLKKGKVLGDAGPLAAQDRLKVGERLQLPDSGRLRELLATSVATAGAVRILYESREILVVDKPPGLAIHASQGHEGDNLTARVEALLAGRGSSFRIAPVHRLDLETSGPVLFGKGKQACGELGKLLMRLEVEKRYLALVQGRPPGSGELRSTLPAKGKQKQARSAYRALVRSERASLLELNLQTGRQHQIRRQLAELGHPLFGDRRYGGPCPAELPRLFLHSCKLAFVDPFSGASLSIDSPLPEDLAGYLQLLELELPK